LSKSKKSENQFHTHFSTHPDDRHHQACEYILASGDAFAIKELKQIKNRPEAYRYYFHKHADKNRTLKIALGLLTGYLTYELLSDNSREEEQTASLERLDRDLEADTIPFDDEADVIAEDEREDDFTFETEQDDDMDKLYADLDDTQYFEEMMDD